MEALRTVSPLTFVLLLLGRFVFSGTPLPSVPPEGQDEVQSGSWMIVFPESIDSEPETFAIGPLEEGESRQFFTQDGDEIVVSRDEDGRTIELNGKEIQSHSHHGAYIISKEDDERHVVRIHKKHQIHTSDVEIDEEPEHHITMSIVKTAPDPEIEVNTLSTGDSGAHILVVDRVNIRKN